MGPSLTTSFQADAHISFNTVQYSNLQSTDPSCGGAKQAGVEVQLQKIPLPPVFSNKYEEREYLKGRLTLAFRVFGKFGFNEGTPFSLMRKSDLILVNKDGEVVDGGSNRLLNKAAYMIHHAIHVARPDVNCAAHSHSLYGRTFCTLGRPIDMLTQDSCAFYKDLAVYRQFKSAVLAKEEEENIAAALGGKNACLLQNHGLLTVVQTVESAIF